MLCPLFFKMGVFFTDSLILSFRLVFPIFLLLALGFFVKKADILDAPSAKKLNKLIFEIFLPVSIFKNVYESELSEVFDKKLIIYGILSVICCFFILLFVVCKICKKEESRGVLIQGIFRSNFLIFGVPVAESLFADGSLSGKAAVMVAIIVPVYNVLAVFCLEALSGKKSDVGKVVLNIIKNPLIIGSVCGFLGLFLKQVGFFIPDILYGSVKQVASIATPLALVALGASLNFAAVKDNAAYIVWGVMAKLVIAPLVFITAGILIGFRDRELAILIAMYASPAAVSSYTMAQQMGADEQLAGHMVVFGTAFSVLTVFLWVTVLTHFGFIVPVM